ncbi:MAG: hypothetical protein AAF639_00835 [Chloroflexota bacterium]
MNAEQKRQNDIAVAQKILAQTFGVDVQLEPGKDEGLSGRTYVHRLRVSATSATVPNSVIMKQAVIREEGQVYDPTSTEPHSPAALLFNDWAGVQFLTEVCTEPLPAPRFYGGSHEHGFFLMEDLGAGERLDMALLGTDAARAEQTLLALFQTLGRMNAQTIGREVRYNEIRSSLGPQPTLTDSPDKNEEIIAKLRGAMTLIDVTATEEFYEDLATLLSMVNDAGPFSAYIHSDACPDNCHWVTDENGEDELRLLDLEDGHFSHALIDGTYAHIPFPSCWCNNRLPKSLIQKAEDVYRAELSKGCPQAQNDEDFYRAVIAVSAYRIFNPFAFLLSEVLEEDYAWGISTPRQRAFMFFDHLAEMCETHGYYPSVGTTARTILKKLHTLWPDTEEMPYYPAFRA